MKKNNFKVFHRTFWKPDPKVRGGFIPHRGRAFFISYAETEDEARDICRVWNANHDEGRFGDRAEFRAI